MSRCVDCGERCDRRAKRCCRCNGARTGQMHPPRESDWSRERIVEAWKAWAVKHDGNPPRKADLKAENGLPSYLALRKHFGAEAQKKASAAAGLSPRGVGVNATLDKARSQYVKGQRNRQMVTAGSYDEAGMLVIRPVPATKAPIR